MLRGTLPLALLFTSTLACQTVGEVRALATQQQYKEAEARLDAWKAAKGRTPEWLEAYSWLGRGALAAKDWDRAETYARQAYQMSLDALKGRKLDDERRLPIALGAAIEVQGQALAGRGQRSEGVAYLQTEMKKWRATSIRTRIQKNINLLSLEGQPAPPLEIAASLGPKPQPLAALKGKAVLLFFWAHWCGDCKAQAPVLARILQTYGGRGLTLVGPTQRYGYVAGGEEAPPDRELAYIDQVRKQFYGMLPDMPVPVSEENFRNYGSSTTPTLVLLDRSGSVRLYHPGNLTYEALSARIEGVLSGN